jgi:hypothetical protein
MSRLRRQLVRVASGWLALQLATVSAVLVVLFAGVSSAIVVTHDQRMIEGFDRVYDITDGRLGLRQPPVSVPMTVAV